MNYQKLTKKLLQWRTCNRKIAFLENVAGKNGSTCTVDWISVHILHHLLNKLKSKQIKDLNVKAEAFNGQEDKLGKTLKDISIGKDFLDRTPAAQVITSRINKCDYIKYKLLHSKGKNWQCKETTREWGKISSYFSGTDLKSITYKER